MGGFELPDKNAAAQRVLANAQALKELGHEVILLGVTKQAPLQSYNLKGFLCYEMAYPSSGGDWFRYLFQIDEELKIIGREKPDALILYNYPAFKTYFFLNRLKNVKIYADVTEWYESKGFSIASIIKRVDVWIRMNRLHVKVNGLIVISKYLEEFYKGKITNILNVPPLVDLNDSKWSSSNGWSPSAVFELTYAGSPGTGNKDRLDLVIRALDDIIKKKHISVQLNIIGLTKEQYIENFSDVFLLNNPDEYSFAVFRGRIPHLDTLDILKKSDYSIFFRNNNLTNTAGFPTKFVESISAGTPVITNWSSNLEDYYNRFPKLGFGIETLNEENIHKVLEIALSKTCEERIDLKKYCMESKLFDFKNYLDEFKLFLEK